MISEVVTPGDRMELIRLTNSFGEDVEIKQFNSKVLDLLDEETAKISMPMENTRIIPLEIGEKYRFCFYTGRGLYHCKGEVIERYREELVPVLIVRFDSELEKFQRRQYYRLEYIMDIQYHVISREEDIYEKRLIENQFNSLEEQELCQKAYDLARNKWNLATIVDISGGGCKFNSNFKHEKGQKITLQIQYSLQEKRVKCKYLARVIFSEEIERKKGWFEHRVEFIDINIDERETLIKFIFEEERKIRRKERGLS